MARLGGKTALIMGAGTSGIATDQAGGGKAGGAEGLRSMGIGRACALLFAREGARVVCLDRDVHAARDTARVIEAEGGRAIALGGDVTRGDDMARAVAETLAEFGALDILVNNVGVVMPGGVTTLDADDWDRAMSVNAKGAFLAMKHAVPAMIARGGGAVVNISSISSIRYMRKSYVAYNASKAAMNQLTRVTAAEHAHQQVRVNAVLPGLIRTPMAEASALRNWGADPAGMEAYWAARTALVPMGRMGEAEDIARAALFLASDEAAFVTGQCLVVDGGTTLGV